MQELPKPWQWFALDAGRPGTKGPDRLLSGAQFQVHDLHVAGEA